MKGGLYQARFYIQSDYLRLFVDEVDPFADKQSKREGPQQALEKAGIKFGKGAKVDFFPRASILMVTQTREQLELVEAFLARDPPARQLSARVEIYELPALQALELVSSAEAEGNHKPERNAVLELVRKGRARLVAMLTLTTRSGVKGKLTDDAESVIDRKRPNKENEDSRDSLYGNGF
ncbi:MAG: hypothetical protein L3J39_19315 [Verrucomicrobiales bacterium]|nr:hypothetical protein [Verrucomicrobiales bacterium]